MQRRAQLDEHGAVKNNDGEQERMCPSPNGRRTLRSIRRFTEKISEELPDSSFLIL